MLSLTLSRSRRVVLAFFATAIGVLLAVALVSIEIHSALRAYVTGQSEWSRAHRHAVAQLRTYLDTGERENYRQFRRSLDVAKGDEVARRQLILSRPDFAVAREGLLLGNNHPDDLDRMIRIFRWFRRFEHTKKLLVIWARADDLMTALDHFGREVDRAMRAGVANEAYRHNAELQIHALDGEISLLERQFLDLLDAGARPLTIATNTLLTLTALALILLVTFVVSQSVNRQVVLAMEEREARFRVMFERAPIGIMMAALDGQFIRVNDRLCELLRYSQEELLQRTFMDITHPEDREQTARNREMLIASAATQTVHEKRYVCGDGSIVRVRITSTLHRSREGVPEFFLGAVEDLSAGDAAEEALRTSEEHFRTLIETGSDIIILCNVDATIRYHSPAMSRILGYGPHELTGAQIFSFVHPDDLEMAKGHFQDQLAHPDQVRRCTMRMRHRDGSWRTLDVNLHNLLAQGRVAGVISTSRDITERLELEQQLESVRRMHSLGRVAASMAHEFNNVLMGIQGFSAVIARRGDGDSAIGNATSQIRRLIERGKRVTQEIMQYTRGTDPDLRVISLRHWLTELMPELQSLLTRSITLRLDVPDDVQTIRGDPEQLSQVLLNLVVNARDAIAGRGTITIRACMAGPDRIHLTVEDDGSGITPEDMERLWEPLFTTKSGGTGLGLPISYQIIERHGGSLRAESEVGRGTIFRIELPAADRDTPPELSRGDDLPALERWRILLVEDDEAIADGLAAVLRAEGLDVEISATGAEACRVFAEMNPDAIILDIGLPDFDGIQVYEMLAAQRPDVPVVFSSGHSDESALSRINNPDARIRFLRKPYEFSQLTAALHGVMNASS